MGKLWTLKEAKNCITNINNNNYNISHGNFFQFNMVFEIHIDLKCKPIFLVFSGFFSYIFVGIYFKYNIVKIDKIFNKIREEYK